ncbi:carbohydrate ABC transporter permease [Halopiger xanaduensis]|uniref:ABC-type transporter, integral membrane subunit n=1 Tax=Halopiger xanaduensis (strain DSM 18323 / JCM 14033 / SH-6) TaxID=797210 RepID=F8D4X2_HALXS|nr:sugar ABC transporter permease [Halopiger xanaduensis]AEH38733.1 ABC-type transporter, integral membrane subunit [Halopiger xanaduensis SH-6]
MSLSTARKRGQELLDEQPFTRIDAGLLLVLPGLLLFLAFMVFPIGYLIWISFTDATHAGTVLSDESQFIGLENYYTLLSDGQFWNSLGITWLFVAISLLFKIIVSISIALVLTHSRVIGKRYMRAIILMPLGFPAIFMITIWRGMFSGARFGVFNQLLGTWNGFVHWIVAGIDTILFGITVSAPEILMADVPIGWLSERWMAFAAYATTEVWLAYPFMMIIIVSALQDVPDQLHDAAKVDGAGYLRRFVHVTLPSIKRPVVFASILTAASSFQQFLLPWVFNRGGPSRQNELLLVYGYREATNLQQYGMASAIMVTAILFIGAFMLIAVKKTDIAEGVNNE